MEDLTMEQLLKNNIDRVIVMMKLAGIESIECYYYGSGDSTDGYDFTHTPADKQDITNMKIVGMSERARYVDGKIVYDRIEEDMTVESALTELIDAINSHHGQDGWWNNEGGYGDFSLNTDGVVSLNHYNYIEETSHDISENGTIDQIFGEEDTDSASVDGSVSSEDADGSDAAGESGSQ